MKLVARRAPAKYLRGVPNEMAKQPPEKGKLPINIKHLGEISQADRTAQEINQAVRARCVAAPDDPADNIYQNTDTEGELIDIGNGQKIRMIVTLKYVMVNGEQKEVTETIVEPENAADVKENQIVVGGYSVNSPVYFQKYFPFAATGKRFVFINALGGGTQEYDQRAKRLSWLGGETSLEKHYCPESAAHVAKLIDRYKPADGEEEDAKLTLAGFSLSGLIVEKMMADPELLSDEHLDKIDAIHLDAPSTTNRAPFGFGFHLLRMVGLCMRHGFAGVVGASVRLSPKFIERIMMSDLRNNVGDDAADKITREVAESCFTATGVFPELVFDFGKDPILGLQIDNPERFEKLKNTPIYVTYRPDDRTVPPAEIIKMTSRWRAIGLNVVITPCADFEKSHMDLPGMSYEEVVRNHGEQVLPLN